MKAKYRMLGGLALAMATPLSAAPMFNFNSIALSANTTDGLNGFADSTAIRNYMNSVAGCSPGCVSSVSGAMATANYNSDGAGYKFPSGPRSGQYMTLGTTDGATSFSNIAAADAYSPDVFIMNNDIFAGSPSINITFSSNLPAGTVVSYDWEIFADNTCAPCTSNFPDVEFYAGGVLQQTHVASSPGAGYFPQDMGHDSITLTAATNSLQWFDWPPEIGMDNLSIVPPPLRTVPEPSPLPLAALALALLALVRRKARRGPPLTRLN